MIYRFEGYTLCSDRFELRCADLQVELEPKALSFLLYLLERRERVVSREELFREIWPELAFVDEACLANVVRKARSAVADDGTSQRVIETVRGQGYRFRAEIEAPSAIPPVSASIPFVGREALVAQFESALAAAVAGQGRLVLLYGEAGIGKTSVAGVLASNARVRGIQVHEVRPWQGEGAPPFWLWRQLLRSIVAGHDPAFLVREAGAGAARVAELVPALKACLDGDAPAAALDPTEARFALFEGVESLLRAATRHRPMLLVLDDLQWADPASLVLLEYLLLRLGQIPILVLAALREDGAPSGGAGGRLLGNRSVEAHRIPPLGRPEVRRFVEQATGAEPDEALVSHLFERSQGIPFYLEELVRLLEPEIGPATAESARAWRSTAPREGPVPARLRHTIRDRLAGASREEREVLEAASVLRSDFGVELARIVDCPPGQLLQILDGLRSRRIVEPVPGTATGHRFTHDLLREVLYEDLPASRRIALHRRAGEVLEELQAVPQDQLVPELARHFAQAAPGGDTAKAMHYASRAGDLMQAALSHEQAIPFYQLALELCSADESVAPTRCDLLLQLGRAYHDAGYDEASRESAGRAMTLARQCKDVDRQARAALAVAGWAHTLMPIDPVAVRALEEALEACGDRVSALRVLLMGSLAMHLAKEGRRWADAEALARDAVALAEQLDVPVVLAGALMSLVRVLRMGDSDDLEERLRSAERARSMAEKAGDRSLVALAQFHRLGVLLELGDIAAVDVALDRFGRDCANLRSSTWLWLDAGYRAMRRYLGGEVEEARTLLAEARGHARPLEQSAAGLTIGCATAVLDCDWENFEEAEKRLRELGEAHGGAPTLRAMLALVLAKAGRRAEAEREIQLLSHGEFEAFRRTEGGKAALAKLAEACADLGADTHAPALYRLLASRRGQCLVTGGGIVFCGPGDLYLGRLCALMGRFDEAESHLEEACELSERLQSPGWLARSRGALAEMLLRRRRTGDLARARHLLGQACAAAEALGWNALPRELEPLSRQAGRRLAG